MNNKYDLINLKNELKENKKKIKNKKVIRNYLTDVYTMAHIISGLTKKGQGLRARASLE